MRIVSWNMNNCMRSQAARRQAWDYLRDEIGADLALVQEASPPGEFASVYNPIDEKKFNWGSAVVALRPGLKLRARKRVSLTDCYLTPAAAGELPDSHPGACAVADILDARGRHLFTAVSLYGQWEVMPGQTSKMYACARLHRMISDLTGVLESSKRFPVVLAGDLNMTTQGEKTQENQATAVFARLRAWGMTDCIAHTRASRPGLTDCGCPDGDACAHVQTYRHNNRPDSQPKQLDYALISRSLVPAMAGCHVLNDDAGWRFSDHCPVVVDLDERTLGWTP